jgi:hypothetical protein
LFNVLEGCLSPKPEERLKLSEILKSKVFDEYREIQWEEEKERVICECCENAMLEEGMRHDIM